MEWQESKTVPGAIDSVGGRCSFRIVPIQNIVNFGIPKACILIAHDHEEEDGSQWARRFASVEEAKRQAESM